MTEKPENPSVFPQATTAHIEPIPGMTLRDYFAGQYLAGIAANSSYFDTTLNAMADESYQASDAMLTARAKSEPTP
jgi:hypothetical protein